ncbi:MAG TPA: hypothetical protein VLE44_00370 [Candidatus Saccharimonadales bacterium]|nr:hypothetical protein [Candidatus Saccharimonadales bacterium]
MKESKETTSKQEKLIAIKQPRKRNDPGGLVKTATILTGSPEFIFQQARETAEDTAADITLTHIPGLGKAGIVESHAAAHLMLSDAENALRDPKVTKIIENLLGGPGPLTVNGNHPGASAVTKAFGTYQLRQSGFMNSLYKNQLGFLENLANKKDKTFDEIAGEQNIEFLAKAFFNDKITPEQMNEVFQYVNSIFGAVLIFAPLKMNETMLRFVPGGFKERKDSADKILNNLINDRLKNPSSEEVKFDLLDFLLKRMPEPIRVEGMTNRKYQSLHKKWLGEIRSTIYQVTFAAKDTTDAALGFSWLHLSKPENFEEQNELRAHARSFFAKKEGKNITFSDLESGDKDILPFLKFFGHRLAENSPTPIDMRLLKSDVAVSGEKILKKGTSLVFDLQNCAQDQELKYGYDYQTPDDLAESVVFGSGPNSCKGAWFAIAKGITNIMTILNETDRVEQSPDSAPIIIVKSTQHVEGLRLNVIKRKIV